MRRLFALITVLFVIFAPTAAPDTDAPRLRIAPPSEILATLIDLSNRYNINLMKGDDLRLSDAVRVEFISLLNSPDTDFETRLAAFTFNGGVRWSFFDVDRIAHPVIAQWLTEYQPDISSTPTHIIGDLHITAAPFDFNTDGTPEWILDVTTESFQYKQTVFAAGEIGSLELVTSQLPWFGDGFHYSAWQSGSSEEQLRQDLTGDAQPELVVALGGVGGGHQNHGRLYVLQWRGRKMFTIADIHYSAPAGGGGALFPGGVNIEYTDLDSSGTTEIILRQNRHDNWGCLSEWVTVYEWRVGLFNYVRQGETEVTFQEDEIGCILKNAHIAFWEGRYPDAIRDYRRFLNLSVSHPEYQPEDFLYGGFGVVLHARVKLAAAYAFINQPRDASETLDKALNDLEQNTDEVSVIATFVRTAHAAYQAKQSATGLCAAMYSTFQDYYRYEAMPDVYWGLVSYDLVPAVSVNLPNPDSARAGCDAPALIAASPDSPESQFAAETLRQADERYAYQRLLWQVRDFKWSLMNLYASDGLTESESERPAYLSSTQLTLKQRLDLTRADLEKFADDPEYGAVVRYHYAWALDDAGFFDDSEVAAAYQSVIDFAPDSPWARLAALHVE